MLNSFNSNTTWESMIAFIHLLYADSQDDFIQWYKKATHETRGGKAVWAMMQKYY